MEFNQVETETWKNLYTLCIVNTTPTWMTFIHLQLVVYYEVTWQRCYLTILRLELDLYKPQSEPHSCV